MLELLKEHMTNSLNMDDNDVATTPDPQNIPIVKIEKAGDCPECNNGIMEKKYTPVGLCCGIFCFPCGLICCKSSRKITCSSCGYRQVITLSE